MTYNFDFIGTGWFHGGLILFVELLVNLNSLSDPYAYRGYGVGITSTMLIVMMIIKMNALPHDVSHGALMHKGYSP